MFTEHVLLARSCLSPFRTLSPMTLATPLKGRIGVTIYQWGGWGLGRRATCSRSSGSSEWGRGYISRNRIRRITRLFKPFSGTSLLTRSKAEVLTMVLKALEFLNLARMSPFSVTSCPNPLTHSIPASLALSSFWNFPDKLYFKALGDTLSPARLFPRWVTSSSPFHVCKKAFPRRLFNTGTPFLKMWMDIEFCWLFFLHQLKWWWWFFFLNL